MFYFTADARDGGAPQGCETCCCAPMSARPGEVNMAEINYADWAAPLLGKGLACGTIFELSPCLNCDESESAPAAPPLLETAQNTPLAARLSDIAPAEQYRIEGRFSAAHGEISDFKAKSGAFVYTPARGFAGYDEIWFSARLTNGEAKMHCLQIAVNSADAALPPPPALPAPLEIDQGRVAIDRRNYLLRFAVAVSPAARPGDIFRLIIRQPALDCDCNKFWHEMCLDITIGKCG